MITLQVCIVWLKRDRRVILWSNPFRKRSFHLNHLQPIHVLSTTYTAGRPLNDVSSPRTRWSKFRPFSGCTFDWIFKALTLSCMPEAQQLIFLNFHMDCIDNKTNKYPIEFSTRRKLYCPSVPLSHWFQQTIPQSNLIAFLKVWNQKRSC